MLYRQRFARIRQIYYCQIFVEKNSAFKQVFSTDNYWILRSITKRQAGQIVTPEEELEEYRSTWTPHKLGEAHQWNFDQFKKAVDAGLDPVIVDNTNVKPSDFVRYVKYAHKAGYTIEIIEPQSDWWKTYRPYFSDKRKHAAQLDQLADILAEKNTHGVPKSVIKNMIEKWRDDFSIEDLVNY